MEITFAKLIKQLGGISPAAASSVFVTSSSTNDDKSSDQDASLQEFVDESEYAGDDHVKKMTRKSGSITRATKREIVHEVLQKVLLHPSSPESSAWRTDSAPSSWKRLLVPPPSGSPRKAGNTHATKREIIHEVLEKMQRKLQEYEFDDHIDEWKIDFAVGTDYAGKTIADIKAEHSRLVPTFQYLVVFRGSPTPRIVRFHSDFMAHGSGSTTKVQSHSIT